LLNKSIKKITHGSMEGDKKFYVLMVLFGVLTSLSVTVDGRPRSRKKPSCADELHKAMTAFATNDAEEITAEYYRLYDAEDRGEFERANYYLPNSWLHYDGKDYMGGPAVVKFLKSQPQAKHTYRKVSGVAIGPTAMSVLILGDMEVEGSPPRKFAQHWYISRARIIVDMLNFFDDEADAAAKGIKLTPMNAEDAKDFHETKP